MIVNHAALLTDDHAQAGAAVTRTDPDPPEAGADPVAEPSSNAHVVPACEILTVWPATFSVPARPAADVAFDEMLTPIAPFPVPVLAVSVAHGTSLVADHAQFDPFAVMPIVPVAPPDPYGEPRPVVLMVTLHASASCVTWNDWPPIVSVPVRGRVVEFGSTE